MSDYPGASVMRNMTPEEWVELDRRLKAQKTAAASAGTSDIWAEIESNVRKWRGHSMKPADIRRYQWDVLTADLRCACNTVDALLGEIDAKDEQIAAQAKHIEALQAEIEAKEEQIAALKEQIGEEG